MSPDNIDLWAWACEFDAQRLSDWAKEHPEWFTADAIGHMLMARSCLLDAIESVGRKKP